MKNKIEAGLRLKAGFDRQYNTPLSVQPAIPTDETTAPVPPPPAPVPQLLALAQQITYQPSTQPPTPKLPEETGTNPRGPRRLPNQVPQYKHSLSRTENVPILHYDAHNHIATNHSTVSLPKRIITIGDPSDRPLKQQRTNFFVSTGHSGIEAQAANHSVPRIRTTQRKHQACQHRALCRERHDVGNGRFIHRLQGDMGPRTSQEETSRTQTALEDMAKNTSALYAPATVDDGQRNSGYVTRHRAPPQSKQVTTAQDDTQTYQEPFPSSSQAHTQQLPSTSKSLTTTSRKSRPPVPPDSQSGRAPTNERHHDATPLTTKSQDPTITTKEHALHQHAEPVRQVLHHNSSRQEPPALKPTGKLQRLVSDISNLGVNNISSYSPTNDELVVLALGLNYIPESKDVSNIEILQAFDEFSDCLLEREKPKQHERSFSNDPVDILRRKLKAKHKLRYGVDDTHMHEPPLHPTYETKSYLAKCKENIIQITRKRNETIHRLSSEESAAVNAVLWNLRTNELIVIKPADKNLGPTIMDRKWYISAGELILQDTHTYQAITSFNVNSIRNELILILHKFDHLKFKPNTDLRYGSWQKEDMFSLLQNHISQQTPLARLLLEPFLDPDLFQACRGYFLPKLHKLEIPFPINPPLTQGRTPPMRPICASIGWITYAVSVLLDILLKPLMFRLHSYILNSAGVAKHLNTAEFPANCALLSADVDSLYPSIDITRGLDAINQALLEHGAPPKDREFTIFLLRWVLFNNVLEFNNKLYLQIRGTAMGTPCAVVFACIFMGMIERRALTSIYPIVPLYYKRFIDDILIIMASLQDCEALKQALNTIDPLIRVTGQPSLHNTNFLDLIIYKESDFEQTHKLDLDLYQKPSNKFLFLPPSSEHAPHVPPGWITGYIRRIRTNCTREPNYIKRRNDFWNQLKDRGFQYHNLQNYFQYDPNRASILHSVRLSPKPQDVPTTIPLLFKIRMSTRTTQILKQLKDALTVYPDNHPNRTFGNPELRNIFQNRQRPIICFRNSKNIGSRLISAKVPPIRPPAPSTTEVQLPNQGMIDFVKSYYQARSTIRK